MTGVGYPQLSAVIECADAGHGLKGLVCADGGCTNAGDVAKAFGAGADFVMLGGMFAGHDECNGEIVYADLTAEERAMIDSEASSSDEVERLLAHKRKAMKFYGMSSATAMHKHAGGVAAYRAPEGKTVEVPYRGPVENTILDILGGVRSACTYVGATQLKELSKRTTFVRVNNQRNFIFGAE
jgi:GMP reductase